MQVSFQSPVAGLIGKLEYNGKFYIRKIHGKYILQRCPNRQNHIPTPHEKANQQRFAERYAGINRKSDRCAVRTPCGLSETQSPTVKRSDNEQSE